MAISTESLAVAITPVIGLNERYYVRSGDQMIGRRNVVVGATLAPIVGNASSARAARVSVGLQCRAVSTDQEPAKPFAINFNLTTRAWQEMEPGGTSVVFKTKNGKYAVNPEGTYLKDAADVNAGFLQDFNPQTAKEKDHRNDGKANETGRIFEWIVDIVVS